MITLSHKSPLEITEFDIEEWLREKRKQGVSFKTLQNMKTACNWWLKVLGHRE